MRLRKWISSLWLFSLLLSTLAAGGHAFAANDISIVLDGRTLGADTSPYLVPKANLTMVPIRVISENLGASVDWSQQTRTVTIRRSGVVITMEQGQSSARVDGAVVKLGASASVRNSRIMVPLRFVSETLGLQVDWNAKTRIIALTTLGGTGTEGSVGTGGSDGSGGSSGSRPAELRGAWISTVYNLDWPSTASYGDPAKQEAEYDKLLDDLQAIGINAVFVQVRPMGDALYPSRLVPWSKYLTGTQGKDPGYDPLAFMVEETHKRGMRFEAWFNPFRAAAGSTTDGLAANHVAAEHPDWIVQAGATQYINPGIPAARQHVIDAIMEVVNGYDIDGVHLDDYFYPSGTAFADDAAYLQYNDGSFANKGDWRRDNVNRFVRDLGQAIHAAKPSVSFGISPFGVWRNQSADPTGSATKASVTSYDDMYADTRTWIRQGWIDYIAPQIYWSLSFSAARFDILAEWWGNEVKGTGVKLYVGHAPYKLGTTEAGWQSPQEIVNQLKYDADSGQVQGDIFFSAKDLLRDPLGLLPLLQTYYGV
ncbi:family 10 glycosylhydrolase [Cohnella zeiphila]|uniref:Family 10 glycosylhydrolase n=1 Tax=Cohnella zeiphila TaxID=2761120 RepID=A0A7X0VYN4_9BACL|nr:family 10 glycosylhydrolase [Cohnella zeiphila]MBB6735186.1 family 10 glycosylhydrolase [Cohnella zeiphila]